MADVDASANGQMSQSPYGVNLSDGIGQGREPEISPTAPDDDLNKNADELDFLNDTDHSTMPNEELLVQTLQRTIAESDAGDHEFRGDLQSFLTVDFDKNEEEIQKQQAQTIETTLEQMSTLTSYARKFSAIGIRQSDVVAVETICPGLLTNGVSTLYTTESSDTNVEFAITQVGDKVKAFADNLLKDLKIVK